MSTRWKQEAFQRRRSRPRHPRDLSGTRRHQALVIMSIILLQNFTEWVDFPVICCLKLGIKFFKNQNMNLNSIFFYLFQTWIKKNLIKKRRIFWNTGRCSENWPSHKLWKLLKNTTFMREINWKKEGRGQKTALKIKGVFTYLKLCGKLIIFFQFIYNKSFFVSRCLEAKGIPTSGQRWPQQNASISCNFRFEFVWRKSRHKTSKIGSGRALAAFCRPPSHQ